MRENVRRDQKVCASERVSLCAFYGWMKGGRNLRVCVCGEGGPKRIHESDGKEEVYVTEHDRMMGDRNTLQKGTTPRNKDGIKSCGKKNKDYQPSTQS